MTGLGSMSSSSSGIRNDGTAALSGSMRRIVSSSKMKMRMPLELKLERLVEHENESRSSSRSSSHEQLFSQQETQQQSASSTRNTTIHSLPQGTLQKYGLGFQK
ncbi:expressed unknown protein [Seminavis robusta]|uniref:Uncharacterized protein n=1 Tax=Seminavis robusta TaxID=568900 RepID=A0A9N8HAC5_9STRA|nr:expressed unknown protein [Seminavis robusta]|eukprot:Sro314_g115100.1 n/a (104) ;mRNA; f:43887-44198